jgi:hypothetical protein
MTMSVKGMDSDPRSTFTLKTLKRYKRKLKIFNPDFYTKYKVHSITNRIIALRKNSYRELSEKIS